MVARSFYNGSARHAVPAMCEWRGPRSRRLISYGTSLAGMWRRARALSGRILAGAKAPSFTEPDLAAMVSSGGVDIHGDCG